MRRWLIRIGTAFGVLLTLLLVYGALVEPRLVLDEVHAEVPLPRIDEELAGTEVAVVAASAAATTAQWCHPGRPQFSDPTGAMNTTTGVEPSRGPIEDVIKRLTRSRGIGSPLQLSLSSSSSFAFMVSWDTAYPGLG